MENHPFCNYDKEIIRHCRIKSNIGKVVNMASFETMGIEEIARAFENNAKKVQDVVPAMLKAGANVLAKRQKEEAENYGLCNTGMMIRSIRPTKIKKEGSATVIDVYPQGRAKHGNERKGDKSNVRNATIGFIAERGTSRIQPRPWMTVATKKAEKRIREVQLEIWEREMNK